MDHGVHEADLDVRAKDEGRPPLGPLVHPHEVTTGGLVMQDERVKVTAALVEHPLSPVDVVLAASRSHPLAQEESVSLDDLQRHVELTVHDSSESKRISDTRIFGGPRVFYLSDFSMKKRAIMLGLGYGWVPVTLVEEELRAGSLVVVPYEGGGKYTFSPVLVHPKDKPLGRAGRLFFERLVAAWG